MIRSILLPLVAAAAASPRSMPRISGAARTGAEALAIVLLVLVARVILGVVAVAWRFPCRAASAREAAP